MNDEPSFKKKKDTKLFSQSDIITGSINTLIKTINYIKLTCGN